MDVLIDCEPDEQTTQYLPESIQQTADDTTPDAVLSVRFIGVKDFQFTENNNIMLFTPIGEIIVNGELSAAGEESILDHDTYQNMLIESSDLVITFHSSHFPTLNQVLRSLSIEDHRSIYVIDESNEETLQKFNFVK